MLGLGGLSWLDFEYCRGCVVWSRDFEWCVLRCGGFCLGLRWCVLFVVRIVPCCCVCLCRAVLWCVMSGGDGVLCCDILWCVALCFMCCVLRVLVCWVVVCCV